jgi:hypothetical protein
VTGSWRKLPNGELTNVFSSPGDIRNTKSCSGKLTTRLREVFYSNLDWDTGYHD